MLIFRSFYDCAESGLRILFREPEIEPIQFGFRKMNPTIPKMLI